MKKNKPQSVTTQNQDITVQEIAALMQSAYLLFENGRLDEALSILDGLSVLVPENPYVFGLLGAIHHKREELNLAVEQYTRALTLLPFDLHSLVNRGEIYLKQGKLVEAAEDLKWAIELDEDGKHPAANRGRFLAAVTQEALQMAQSKGVQAVLEAQNQIKGTTS